MAPTAARWDRPKGKNYTFRSLLIWTKYRTSCIWMCHHFASQHVTNDTTKNENNDDDDDDQHSSHINVNNIRIFPHQHRPRVENRIFATVLCATSIARKILHRRRGRRCIQISYSKIILVLQTCHLFTSLVFNLASHAFVLLCFAQHVRCYLFAPNFGVSPCRTETKTNSLSLARSVSTSVYVAR